MGSGCLCKTGDGNSRIVISDPQMRTTMIACVHEGIDGVEAASRGVTKGLYGRQCSQSQSHHYYLFNKFNSARIKKTASSPKMTIMF